jgi:exodeoxyribonuclease VII large subunit
VRLAETLGIFDLLVIGRGGGSIEDLWAFNEEGLVRAVAACGVPIISAVGHEIDFTLCDFAADVRAETPSGAAELISSHYVACTERLRGLRDTMETVAEDTIARAQQTLAHARSRLRLLSPKAGIERNYLRLDDLGNRLRAALRASMQSRRELLTAASRRLQTASPSRRVEVESHRLLALWKRLESASPASVLKRGYAIVRDADGRPVHRASEIVAGQALVNEFHDGKVNVRAE